MLKVACWNVRTMLDRADSCRPERRSALIAHELSRLNIDIAALSEVRFSGEGSLQEHGAGYTLYWSGKPETERRLSGVGFMVRNSIASKLENQPTGHSDRIISMRLPLWNQQYATLFSVYYIYIYIVFLFSLHYCPLLIPLYNTAVLIDICRFFWGVWGGAVSRSPKGSDAQYIASPSQV